MRIKPVFAILSFSLIILSYQNCGNVVFSTVPVVTSATTTAIRQFQPALIVRDTSCVICHANIQANMVTDFGNNNSWYMGGSGGFTTGDYGSSHYDAQTWQSLEQLSGQVIVPNAAVASQTVANVIAAGQTAPTTPIPVSSFLTMNGLFDMYGAWYDCCGGGGNTEPAGNTSFTANVTAPAGKAAVATESVLYIGAPTSAQILSLVQNTSAAPWVQAVGASSTGISGFSVVNGVNGTSYVTNSGPVQCSGKDVVINGTLLLNSAQIYAENNGCRLYVNGSVFIEGPITYLNSANVADPTDNLQISSSVSIIMGVGLTNTIDPNTTNNPLQRRLIADNRGLVLRSAPTTTAFTNYANGIMAEANNIGTALIVDSSTYGTLPTSKSYGGVLRANIDFQHILLNAPLIHSRYLGTISGVIVAESILSSLGEFSFHYDPVFQTVPVFPALNVDIACVGNSTTPCNPAAQ